MLDKFNDTMQKELTKTNGSLDSDIITAFNSISSTMSTPQVNWEFFLFGVIWLGLVLFMMYITISTQVRNSHYSKAEKIPFDAQEQTCEYCGGKYIVGTRTNCPHCGATILHYSKDSNNMTNDMS